MFTPSAFPRPPRPRRLAALVITGALALAACAPANRLSAAAGDEDAVTAFHHPGVVVGRSQLDTVRTRVRAGQEPWRSAYEKMRASKYGSLDYTAHPVDVVPCPPNAGPPACLAEREDAIAAYTQALLWSVNGDEAHVRKAVEIMDGWSKVVKGHTEGNAGLQTAWAGSSWARAADMVHAGYPKWPGADVQRFKWMLRKAYLPAVTAEVPDHNGNWELATTDATIGIAVFLYGPMAQRLRAALEFHARYQLGEAAPPWLCGGRVERTMGPDVEVALNHLRNRLRLKLPETEKLAERQRPAGTDDLFVAWETLTHAENPGAKV